MRMEGGTGEVLFQKPLPLSVDHEGSWTVDFSWNERKRNRTVVGVTGATSYLGLRIVRALLDRGYSVRVIVHSEEDLEEVRGKEDCTRAESVVVARMGDVGSLCEAFRECDAIFHTSSFIDPKGVSGYTEWMAAIEAAGARNVIEACGRATITKRCVLTSSLLACIWPTNGIPGILDESCWSDEDFCRANKLWLALGKTAMEKTAWRKAEEMQVKLATVCHSLLMDRSVPFAYDSASITYLKGGVTMHRRGVLAAVDVSKVVAAHIGIYEQMDRGAHGRYLCFDRIIREEDEVIELENRLKMHGLISRGRNLPQQQDVVAESECIMRNAKLTKLMSHAHLRCNTISILI